MMSAIDHTNTRVLLIGATEFPDDPSIQPIPNIHANLKQLADCLCNPDLIGIPAENITVSVNEKRNSIEKKLKNVVKETKNRNFTLLVYYSGHGIMSAEEFRLFLTTTESSRADLEIDSLDINLFKKYIRQSGAGRKIVILDYCHSGAILGSMNDPESALRAQLKGFEGTYMITSAAEDMPSLYPVNEQNAPTYFTGELLHVIRNGIIDGGAWCTLRDIFHEIDNSFAGKGLPRPQQSSINTADQLYFAKNKLYTEPLTEEEKCWKECLAMPDKWAFNDYLSNYPTGQFAKTATQKLYELEDAEAWNQAADAGNLYQLNLYLQRYPQGNYVQEAREKIRSFRAQDQQQKSAPATLHTTPENPAINQAQHTSAVIENKRQKRSFQYVLLFEIIIVLSIIIALFTFVIISKNKADEAVSSQKIRDIEESSLKK